jgi:mono/diheme cytochrome c family protein
MRRALLFPFLALFIVNGQAPKPAAPKVDFARQIRPVLSDNCFHCHGPDKGSRAVNLRFDLKDEAFAARPNGARAIVPGKPDESLLYQRITSSNKAKKMPPAYSHKELTPAQIDTFKRWIEQGAEWKEHWAYQTPVKASPPVVRNVLWAKNAIDKFILVRLEAQGLKPAPEADRRTLARRVALDVTGLPPTPEDVDAFVSDKSANAYERLVDKYLALPQWGEHRGRYWLDAARYADTHGLHIDNYREMWPYRDWVLKAFNKNMPWDQFTVEQLAGDMLPNPTLDQQIASGFHRCNVTTNEGGVIPEEVAAIYAKDRVDTTGTVFLGLTVGCATCHDHKFDPISAKDFYSLAAFFRNTKQNPLDGNIPDTPPIIVVPRDEDRARWGQLAEDEKGVREKMARERSGAQSDFVKWLDGKDRRAIVSPVEMADEVLALDLAAKTPVVTFKNKPLDLTLPEGAAFGAGHLPKRKAITFSGKNALELPNVEYFEADKPFSISAWMLMPQGEDNYTIASQLDPKSKNRGWTFEINARQPFFRLTGAPGKSLVVRGPTANRLVPGTWNHMLVTYDGSRRNGSLAIYINGVALPAEGRGESAKALEGEIRTFVPLRVGGDGRSRGLAGGAIAEFRVLTREVSPDEAKLLAEWPRLELARERKTEDLDADEWLAFEQYYLQREHGDYVALCGEMDGLREERRQIARRGAITHVQFEKPTDPFAHILNRGMYDAPREKVTPNTPTVLPPMGAYPRNRLGLAQWLIDPAHPLFSRVAVNRFWQEVFGTGLVKTADDFGSQGEAPSHPELLDWLAVDFRENNWDVKRFFKQMLMSAAYRQSAVTDAGKLAKDPDNRLISRGPRFRMDAEMVRDYALAASGLLNGKIGGESVKPYQPEGIWETVAMLQSNTRFYKRDAGDKLYRRSIYWFWKRSAPPPSMDIFNAPSRENCTVRRERTNTPLQALVTMNDPQFVEAGRALAQGALRAARADLDKQLDYMTARALARSFDPREKEIARKAYKDLLNHYDSKPADAKKLLAVGESDVDAGLPKAELAALTMLANNIFNLDEVLTK